MTDHLNWLEQDDTTAGHPAKSIDDPLGSQEASAGIGASQEFAEYGVEEPALPPLSLPSEHRQQSTWPVSPASGATWPAADTSSSSLTEDSTAAPARIKPGAIRRVAPSILAYLLSSALGLYVAGITRHPPFWFYFLCIGMLVITPLMGVALGLLQVRWKRRHSRIPGNH